MLCGAVAFRELTTSPILYDVLTSYSDDPYQWTRAEYLSLPLSVTGYFFFTSLFKGGFPKGLSRALGLSALFWLPFQSLGQLCLLAHLSLCISCMRSPVSRLLLCISWLFLFEAGPTPDCAGDVRLFFVAVINDILYSNDVIATTFVIPYAAALFMLVNSAVVAKKFSNAMDERDVKSQELLSTYQQLDDELLKRENLEASNQALARDNELAAQQLIQADKLATMGTMVAGVAHDIANPTGLIQGSTVLMEETRETLRTTVLAL